MRSFFVWVHSINGLGGQASITRSAIEIVTDMGLRVKIIEFGVLGFFSFFSISLSILYLIFSKADIYFPASRSFWGAFRDLPIYILSVFGRRVIVHIHGSDFEVLFYHKILGRLLTNILSNRVIVIATNSKAKIDLERLGCQRVHRIENFFPSKYLNLDTQIRVPNTFYWNSNILATKGIFEFLDAFVEYSNKSGATLCIAGEIMECMIMTKNDTRLKLESYLCHPNITYMGSISRSATLQQLIKSEVCVLTSLSESQPLALIDGMCAGCRIICSDLPELREMTNEYPAVYYTAVTPSSILEALSCSHVSVGFDPCAASKIAQQRFSENLFNSRLRNIFLEKEVC